MTYNLNALSSESRRRLLLLFLIGVLAVILGFFTFKPITAVTLVHRLGYYWMLLAVGLFGCAFGRLLSWRQAGAQFLAGGWRVVLVILAITAWIHVQEPHGFKVVNDEIQLVSTSQRMHFRREAATVARGYTLGGDFTVMQGMMDKRPLLFPFLVSVLHDFTGYRPENAFWLNALLTPALFGLIYLVLCEMAGRAAGICGMLLFATLPLLSQVCASAGFDLLNLVMILLVVWLGLGYIRKRDGAHLSAFCLAGVLLAQVRYESVLYVLPIAGVVAYGWWLDRKVSLPWGCLAAPLLLVITPLQANVVKVSPGLLQLGDHPSASGLYSLDYFYDNMGRALGYFCSLDQLQANSHLLALLGLLGIGFFWMLLYRRTRRAEPADSKHVVWAIFFIALCAQGFLMLCYFWGAYNDVVTVRLSLPTQLLFVLAFVYVYPELVSWRRRWLALGVVSLAYMMIWTGPVILKRGYAKENLAAEFNNRCRDYIQTLGDRNIFVIDPSSRIWSLYEIPCVGLSTLANRVDGFLYHYDRGSFRACLLVQKLTLKNPATGEMAPVVSNDFGSVLKLEKIKDFRFSPTYVMRISRITDVDAKALHTWAKEYLRKEDKSGEKKGSDDKTLKQELKYSLEWMRNLP